MALKIFISSVSIEFDKEKEALQEEIISLQELFTSMEFFGSDPRTPADYCRQLVKQSNLYVGLIGTEFGSLEATSQMSFTEFEYQAAVDQELECLIYISPAAFGKNSEPGEGFDDRQRRFIRKLKSRHTCQVISSTEKLRTLFLKDFIKLLREGRFGSLIPLRHGPLPMEILHGITKAVLPEQIKAVGQEKYIPEIYTPRKAEGKIAAFVNFEKYFSERGVRLIEKLTWASERYGLEKTTTLVLARLKITVRDFVTEEFDNILEELKKLFYFYEVAKLITEIDTILAMESLEEASNRTKSLTLRLQQTPFVAGRSNWTLLGRNIYELKRRGKTDKSDPLYVEIMQLFPSFHDFVTKGEDSIQLCNSLILQLQLLMNEGCRNCIVLVDKAGAGKTNIACHTAESLAAGDPVLLLSGQTRFSGEFDLDQYVQKRLELQLAGFFSDWTNRIGSGLRKRQKWFYIIIDGINENPDRVLLINLLNNFLSKIGHKRIRVILTCRDLLWESFQGAITPYLFRDVIAIENYTNEEWRKAIKLYFEKYQIGCELGREAEDALKNPLLLRFFCEANQGRNIGQVATIKLAGVFDLYLKRISNAVREKLATVSGDPALLFLLQVAGEMWKQRSPGIRTDDIKGEPSQVLSGGLLYSSLLSENIILEEEVHPYSSSRTVKFLYDAFMEYILARTWVEKIDRSAGRQAAVAEIIQDVVDSLDNFPAVFGGILFLDQLWTSGEPIIHIFIKTIIRRRTISSQMQLIYAFDRVDPLKLDEELIAGLKRFYHEVSDGYRDRLAYIIPRILVQIPEHPFAKQYAGEVLGIHTRRPRETWSMDPRTAPRLPPARYRYSEDTKLSAIGLLIQRGDQEDFELIRQGIDSIGRTDIDSALKAMKSMDRLENGFLYKTLHEYASLQLAEYRLFSAYLLRDRYGKEPAQFLLKLLTDRETRVHEYTFSLFNTRRIETELLDLLLHKCGDPDVHSWHLLYFIRLFGKRERFDSGQDRNGMETRIARLLEKFTNHEKGFVRLDAYRSCLQYPEYLDRQKLKKRMAADPDIYVQHLGRQIRL